jgi:AAA+ ATPase superfamily predicted ATPase
MFEVLVDELIRTKYVLKQFSFTEIGRWWHGGEEIDIVALNETAKEIVFVECKWHSLSHKEAEKVLFDLQEKSKHVDWNIGKRKEYFAIFAKKIEGKETLRKSGYILWDLDDYY